MALTKTMPPNNMLLGSFRRRAFRGLRQLTGGGASPGAIRVQRKDGSEGWTSRDKHAAVTEMASMK